MAKLRPTPPGPSHPAGQSSPVPNPPVETEPVSKIMNPQPPLDPSEPVLIEKEPAQLIANASGLIIGLLALSGVLLTQEDHELIKGAVALLTPLLINYLQGRAIRASVYSPASLRKISS